MKRVLKTFLAALVCLAFNQTAVLASSHREAPLISNDPLADNTDLYAFRSPVDNNKVVLIANYIPFEHPAGGPNWYTFGENIRYEIHVKNNAATTTDDITYRFTFKHVNEDGTTFFNIRLGKQNIKATYTLERSVDGGASFQTIISNGVVPPPNIGPRSIENATLGVGGASYDDLMNKAIATASTGERVYCGPADDPFFVDLGGAFDVGGFRKNGRDGLAKFNCHSIVVEVPIATLQKDHKTVAQAANILDPNFVIGVYASASRRQITTLDSSTGTSGTVSGNWVQVSRLGMPLTNEAVIPVGYKDKWNASSPGNDLDFAKFFKNPELSLYMDDSQFGGAVPGLASLRVQSNSLGAFDFRNGKKGLYGLKGSSAVAGTALDDAIFGNILLPDSVSPRAVDILPIFYTGVPNLKPYQLATGKNGNPLAAGKPFINNFLPTLGDLLRLNMAVPVTPRNSADFSSLGIVQAAVLGLTDARFNANADLQFIPNMDGFPNGRRLEDDVTTIELQAVSGVALAAIGLWYDDYNGTGSPVTTDLVNVLSYNAGVTHNDTTLKTNFPFVQAPWRGFTGAGYVGPKSLDPLPVTFVSFVANKKDNFVNLNWEVTNEVNNSHYDVERSLGSVRSFAKIGSVTARTGNTNIYNFTDVAPSLDQANYYRLKQVDKDGKFSYSPIRVIAFNPDNVLTVSPNPSNGFIKITSSAANVQVVIYDLNGKRVAAMQLNSGAAQMSTSKLSKGLYTVVAQSNGTKLAEKKIVVQ
jgi:hypothetical protein